MHRQGEDWAIPQQGRPQADPRWDQLSAVTKSQLFGIAGAPSQLRGCGFSSELLWVCPRLCSHHQRILSPREQPLALQPILQAAGKKKKGLKTSPCSLLSTFTGGWLNNKKRDLIISNPPGQGEGVPRAGEGKAAAEQKAASREEQPEPGDAPAELSPAPARTESCDYSPLTAQAPQSLRASKRSPPGIALLQARGYKSAALGMFEARFPTRPSLAGLLSLPARLPSHREQLRQLRQGDRQGRAARDWRCVQFKGSLAE